MLPRKICYVSVRFISKSLIRDKLIPVGEFRKKKTQDIQPLDNVVVSVETDAKRLVKYVCGTNLLQEGGEDVKIKADSEYPSWLKKIEGPKSIEELEFDTKEFWKKLRKLKIKEAAYIKSITKTGSVHK